MLFSRFPNGNEKTILRAISKVDRDDVVVYSTAILNAFIFITGLVAAVAHWNDPWNNFSSKALDIYLGGTIILTVLDLVIKGWMFCLIGGSIPVVLFTLVHHVWAVGACAEAWTLRVGGWVAWFGSLCALFDMVGILHPKVPVAWRPAFYYALLASFVPRSVVINAHLLYDYNQENSAYFAPDGPMNIAVAGSASVVANFVVCLIIIVVGVDGAFPAESYPKAMPTPLCCRRRKVE
jgi:hypothetical protein